MAAAGKAAGPVAAGRVNDSQQPRCKQRGVKLAALQSSGVFDPRGSRQMCMQACPLGSLPAGIKRRRLLYAGAFCKSPSAYPRSLPVRIIIT